MTTQLSDSEIEAITGYRTPSRQLQTLHERGFTRAYRNRQGKVVLERPHYDAVCRGEFGAQAPAKPAVNVAFLRKAA
ncbi:DUF4224 domain-containing protein [Hydrogenophaga pseudoflava]|uniref:DUF4224 domain-containing protein n=1 Tax=Hydrogenophaga pseudoflava TaxID=47421 RepID=UPI0027E44FDE|nr:DUF4224 domain-containing protein [Hydrogenophaga pseudoflava]MDQ7745399.1 DUF4224 domain-containing protein [Hydrogenophaga pseudoflava]